MKSPVNMKSSVNMKSLTCTNEVEFKMNGLVIKLFIQFKVSCKKFMCHCLGNPIQCYNINYASQIKVAVPIWSTDIQIAMLLVY